MLARLNTPYRALISVGTFLQPFFLLAVRLFWGFMFFMAGFGKFGDIQAVAGFFETLGIPWPTFNAYLVAAVETAGGLLLIIGFASRLVAIPLIITMFVALLTAHREAVLQAIDNPSALVKESPFTFLMAGLIVLLFGPGAFSVDALIKRFKKS